MVKHGNEPFLECSSKGDKRFSAFYARLKSHGNSSIEELYQANKVFKDGNTGLSIEEAKGRKAVNMTDCKVYYAQLWDVYIKENLHLARDLIRAQGLSDMFGKPGCQCQATELWRIRSKYLVVNVINLRNDKETPAHYVGRPTPLGNPFTAKQHGRTEAINKYAFWLHDQIYSGNKPVKQMLKALAQELNTKGQINLSCWCAPKPCHIDIIGKCLKWMIRNEYV